MDLKSLDERRFARSIEEEVERLNSLPIELSAIQSAKSILESNISYTSGLLEVATPEESVEIQVRLAQLKAHLLKIHSELAERNRVDNPPPVSSSEENPPSANSDQMTSKDRTAEHRNLLKKVLDMRRHNGESDTVLLNDWIKDARLSRTSVTDYLAARMKGRVSPAKREEIEAKIRASAVELGVLPRTDSD